MIHLEPQTECTGTSTGTKQQTKRKGHQPSHIAHRTKAITRLPISEGSYQNPDTRDDDSLVQFAQSFVQYFLRHMPCCLLSLQPTRLQFLPASCNVAAQRQEEKDSFTLSLLCRRPREPGTSLHPRRNQRPSTINPNLIRPSSKRPFFFAAPYGEAAALDLARDKNSQSHLRLADHRLASLPMLEPRLVGNISWCAHRCDVRIDTSSIANGLEGCPSSLDVSLPCTVHAKAGNTP